MKSLNFVKERIDKQSANLDVSADAKWVEIDFVDKVQTIAMDNKIRELLTDNKFKSVIRTPQGDVEVSIKQNTNADFEYFTMERCTCDGTLLFAEELFSKILNKLIKAETVNKEKYKQVPYGGEIVYTVGNFVMCEEFGDFGTKEKPWLNSRFTVMLPIKFDVIEKKN